MKINLAIIVTILSFIALYDAWETYEQRLIDARVSSALINMVVIEQKIDDYWQERFIYPKKFEDMDFDIGKH